MNKIKQLREKHDLTQQALADRLGYSRSLITKWETGSVKPTQGQMIDICNIFNVPLQFLTDNNGVVDEYNKKYIKLNTTKHRFIISALTESIIYLLGCLAMGISLFYFPSNELMIAFAIVFGFGIIGIAVAPFLLSRNARNRDSDLAMKRWVVKTNIPKKEFRSIKSDKEMDTKFNKIILDKK